MVWSNLKAGAARVASTLKPPADVPQSDTRMLIGDVTAGIISGIIVLSYCLSFSSLLFAGPLTPERPSGLWALLVGSIVVGLVVTYRTSLPPLIAAPDTAGVAVLAGLSMSVAARVAEAGGGASEAAAHILLCFSLAGAAAGLLMLVMGSTQTAAYIRFVPYPVAAGFIGATGLLMIVNSLQVVVGTNSDLFGGIVVPRQNVGAQLAVAACTALLLVFIRWRFSNSIAVPVAFLAVTAAVQSWVRTHPGTLAIEDWFSRSIEPAIPWSAVRAASEGLIDWRILAASVPEMLAFAGVMIVSALIKTTNIEVARLSSADLDQEFMATGWANVAAAILGGIGGSTQTTPSRALTEAGGSTRLSSLVSAVTIAAALLAQVDLASLVPTPVLAGLLIYFGWTSLVDMLGRPSAHLSWLDFALILLILATCARFGYPTGGLIGFVLSCIIFVFRYRAIGAVRRHMTRATMASILIRPPEDDAYLRSRGEAVHVYFLSGYLFFGSSDSLYERIRSDVDRQQGEAVRFLVLDLASVSGLDISALKSLAKLTGYCERRGIRMAYTGLQERYRRALESGRFIGSDAAKSFETRSDALEWAEEELLAEARSLRGDARGLSFEEWLSQGLEGGDAVRLLSYLQVRSYQAGTLLYQQGQGSDTIDFVASELVAITIKDQGDRKIRVRRMSRHTVVGEMGFFRGSERTANVEIEQDSVVYTMTRESLDRMMREAPHVSAALMRFIIRILSDRLEFANNEIAALM